MLFADTLFAIYRKKNFKKSIVGVMIFKMQVFRSMMSITKVKLFLADLTATQYDRLLA